MAKNKHLTLDMRKTIEVGLDNNSTRTAIAKTLGMDKSTICKEIIKHAFVKPENLYGRSKQGTFDCIHLKECGFSNFCSFPCEKRESIPCKRKDKPSGVCNGCPKRNECRLPKKVYDAERAQKEYKYELRDSREGINLTTSEAKRIGEILKRGVDNGLSIYAILNEHPDIGYSVKTIYTFISEGVFSANGLIDLDLRSKVSRKKQKHKIKTKPRESKKHLQGRTYKDFENYMLNHPNASIIEMDTVYNDITRGPFIQTFALIDYTLLYAVYHDKLSASNMVQGFKFFYDQIGAREFKRHSFVILTDRGTEFTKAQEFEAFGCKIFYCDPMQASQKPNVEQVHRLLRYICPKGKNLRSIGLTGQAPLNLALSHINSYVRASRSNRSPFEVYEFFHPDSTLLEDLQIKKIDPDKLILKPDLLK